MPGSSESQFNTSPEPGCETLTPPKLPAIFTLASFGVNTLPTGCKYTAPTQPGRAVDRQEGHSEQLGLTSILGSRSWGCP